MTGIEPHLNHSVRVQLNINKLQRVHRQVICKLFLIRADSVAITEARGLLGFWIRLSWIMA